MSSAWCVIDTMCHWHDCVIDMMCHRHDVSLSRCVIDVVLFMSFLEIFPVLVPAGIIKMMMMIDEEWHWHDVCLRSLLWICIVSCRGHTSKVLRYSTHTQGISQFYLHICIHLLTEWTIPAFCLPSRSWYSFTNPGGMEGWIGLAVCHWHDISLTWCVILSWHVIGRLWYFIDMACHFVMACHWQDMTFHWHGVSLTWCVIDMASLTEYDISLTWRVIDMACHWPDVSLTWRHWQSMTFHWHGVSLMWCVIGRIWHFIDMACHWCGVSLAVYDISLTCCVIDMMCHWHGVSLTCRVIGRIWHFIDMLCHWHDVSLTWCVIDMACHWCGVS